MAQDRWTTGLARAVSNGAPGCSCISNDRADAVEELINSAQGLLDAVQPTGLTPGAAEVEVLLRAAQRVLAAVRLAKNWK